MAFPAPPVHTPFFADDDQGFHGNSSGGSAKRISHPWLRWFQEVSLALTPGTAVSGSRAGGEALTNLLTTLATQGTIQDKTTA